MPKYLIRPWHGEGRSLFYVIAQYSDDEHDWGIIASFLTQEKAEAYIRQIQKPPAR